MHWIPPSLIIDVRTRKLLSALRTGLCAILAAPLLLPPAEAANTYASACSSCHGPLASSERRGRSASQIRSAINADRGGMGALRGLTNAELNDIARELGGEDNLPEPSASPKPAPAPSPSSSPLPSPPPGACNGAGDKPLVNALPDQDASVGQTLSITVSAVDCNDVPIIIKASKLKGSSMPATSQDFDDSGLWTGIFTYTPTQSQANKSFTVKFTAVETEDERKASTPRPVRIRVFPAGSSYDDGAVTAVKIQSARWSNGNLRVKGKVLFSKALNAAERGALASGTNLSLTDASGAVTYASAAVKPNGEWSVQAPATAESGVPCEISAQFNGKSATPRTVKKAPDCSR